MRRVVLPLVALLLAGVSTFAVRGWLESQRRPAAVAAQAVPEQRKAVLVAAADLSVGAFVQPDSLRWQDWPDVTTPDSYLVRGAADEAALVGAVVRRPVGAGQPITAGSVVKPGERGFLAAVLESGMRAISVPVDEASGNAGLIFPGDRVDLILTQTIEIAGDPAGARRVSETAVTDLRVIAMGAGCRPKAGTRLARASRRARRRSR
jgi:pilus assembly protein CpaB